MLTAILLIFIVCMLIACIVYALKLNELTKSASELSRCYNNVSEELGKTFERECDAYEAVVNNRPATIKKYGNSWAVVREFKTGITIIKIFSDSDRAYTQYCAEELCDLINERV